MSTVEDSGSSGARPEDRWEKEFPKSLAEANMRLARAQAAYRALELPDTVLDNTKSRTLPELLARRAKLMEESLYPEWTAYQIPEVPQELEEWARLKMHLALDYWVASAMRSIYIERRMTKSEKAEFGDGKLLLERTPEEEAEWKEVVNVDLGWFRIDIVNGKYRLVGNGYGDLFKQAVDAAMDHNKLWDRRFQGRRIARYPILVETIKALAVLPQAVKNPSLLENMFLTYYFAFWSRKLKDEESSEALE